MEGIVMQPDKGLCGCEVERGEELAERRVAGGRGGDGRGGDCGEEDGRGCVGMLALQVVPSTLV